MFAFLLYFQRLKFQRNWNIYVVNILKNGGRVATEKVVWLRMMSLSANGNFTVHWHFWKTTSTSDNVIQKATWKWVYFLQYNIPTFVVVLKCPVTGYMYYFDYHCHDVISVHITHHISKSNRLYYMCLLRLRHHLYVGSSLFLSVLCGLLAWECQLSTQKVRLGLVLGLHSADMPRSHILF